MSETVTLTVTDDDGNEPDNVVLAVNDTPVASTMDESDDTVEITPAMRMGVGPAQLADGDFAQAWIRVEEGQTLNLLGWGLIDSNEDSPDGIELALMNSGTEVATATGVAWDEPEDPIASVDGPANVFVQVINNTGSDLTADSSAQDWLAAHFEYEVV
jgi:hypothetical protein